MLVGPGYHHFVVLAENPDGKGTLDGTQILVMQAEKLDRLAVVADNELHFFAFDYHALPLLPWHELRDVFKCLH